MSVPAFGASRCLACYEDWEQGNSASLALYLGEVGRLKKDSAPGQKIVWHIFSANTTNYLFYINMMGGAKK